MKVYKFTEDDVELAALEWLGEVGYSYLGGPEIAPGETTEERQSYREVILEGRLRAALQELNDQLPLGAIDDAFRLLTRTENPNLTVNNHRFHQMLVDGVPVNYQDNGRTVYANARVLDWDDGFLKNNDWLAVNQFSVRKIGAVQNPTAPLQDTRRPDIVLFVNGLPLGVIELKNPTDEDADVESAYKQLQTYKAEIPDLFTFNEILVVADGIDARMGTLTGGFEWFKRWRTIDGEKIEKGRSRLETLIKGALAPERLLDLIRHFTVFETQRDAISKKTAGYHQYHAANKAVESTLRATSTKGDAKVGVVWHTQGSGKSLTMLFYAGKVVQQHEMENPTLVVLTDRNDLDDQLFDQFAAGHDLLRQQPHQAENRSDMRERLSVASGGVVFTTIQKFLPQDGSSEHPLLSDRRNIVFIVDEAHRTQYGFEARFIKRADRVDKVYGLAKYMRDALPNASFIGFSGTPISQEDRNTRAVFGEYLDIYDIQRAVDDQATVPIYYDARHAKLELDKFYQVKVDPDFEEITEGAEISQREYLKTKWAAMEKIVGDPDRVALVAEDIVQHYETRDAALPGKAMIVCMSREICIRMHDQIKALRPDWYHRDDDKGMLKVVMTGSASDGDDWQEHIRDKRRRKAQALRFRNPATDFKIVIVRDMWLTGFDAPSLHTMYVDKPMKGHNLMQAIARVNRVYPGKDGGLVVAYLPLQSWLTEALKDYTEQDQENAGRLQDVAARIMMEKYEVVKGLLHGFDYSGFIAESPTERLTTLSNAVDHILEGKDENRDRFIAAVTTLSRAYALATPHEKALAIRDEVGFFKAVKAPLVKSVTTGLTGAGVTTQALEAAIQEIVTRAVAPEGVVDLMSISGLQQTDIAILSEEFLTEVNALPQKNLAVELIRRLLDDEIRNQRRKNLIQSRSFAGMLQDSLDRYNKDIISAAEILAELITLAREMRESSARGDDLGLSDDELAFYDALEVNDSAVAVLGEPILKEIAQELVKNVRKSIAIDWELRESARARMRIIVKRILRKHGYPPDKQKKAAETVIAQAELLSKSWVEVE